MLLIALSIMVLPPSDPRALVNDRAARDVLGLRIFAVHDSWTLICFPSPPSSPRRILWPWLI
jgi:hypothetical protein